jgi:hypothetical protein
VLRTDGVSHQLLGVFDDALGLTWVIKAVELQDVGGEDPSPQHLEDPRVCPLPCRWPGVPNRMSLRSGKACSASRTGTRPWSRAVTAATQASSPVTSL